MSFATPIALAWPITVPIVVFYILKIRLRQSPVSTMIFWRQIFEEKRPRSLWQQLRHLALAPGAAPVVHFARAGAWPSRISAGRSCRPAA